MTTLYNKVPYFKKILVSNKRKQRVGEGLQGPIKKTKKKRKKRKIGL